MSKNKEGSITPETRRLKYKPQADNNVIKETYTLYESSIEKLKIEKAKHENLILSKNESLQSAQKIKDFFKNAKSPSIKLIEEKISELQQKIVSIDSAVQIFDNLSVIPRKIVELKIFQLRKPTDIDDIEMDPALPLIRHYGINVDKPVSGYLKGHIFDSQALHPIEISIFEDAVNYLQKKCSADQFLSIKKTLETEGENGTLPVPNNIILASFFPRDKTASTIIREDKHNTEEIETHTIVLWKTQDKEITIIDPSNRDYSEPLCKILDNYFAPLNLKFTMEQYTLYTDYQESMSKKIFRALEGKIYDSSNVDKNDEKTYQNLKRDCTDIAIKIGFELNDRQLEASTNTINECLKLSIENITNVFLPKSIGLLHPLQSSDPELRLKTKKLLDKQKTLSEINYQYLQGLDLSKVTTADDINLLSGLLDELHNEEGL